jgi:hypothetical protein
VEREGEAEDGDRAGVGRRATGDPCPGGAPAGDQREPGERALAELPDDRDPRRVELACGCRGSSPGDAVGLLDERDGDRERAGGLGGGLEVGRVEAAAGPVTEHQRGDGQGDREQVRPGRPVRCVELDDPTSLARADGCVATRAAPGGELAATAGRVGGGLVAQRNLR